MSLEVADITAKYFSAKEQIFSIEGKAAASALTARVIQDIRHILDHLMIGLSSEKADEQEKHYSEVISHLENYVTDSYEVVAGRVLKSTTGQIDRAGFLGKTGEARNLQNEAIQHYTRGRAIRTAYPGEAVKAFEKCIDLSLEARLKAEGLTIRDKIGIWALIVGIALTILNILDRLNML